jgi:hypothetical protein
LGLSWKALLKEAVGAIPNKYMKEGEKENFDPRQT